MRQTRNIVVLFVCFVLFVLFAVSCSLALFNAKSELTNTYSVNGVRIALDEAQVNQEGYPIDDEGKVVADPANAVRVKRNHYHLMPGHRYTKDPTITVKGGSTDCYIRLLVSINKTDILADIMPGGLTDLFVGYDSAVWKLIKEDSNPEEDIKTLVFQYFDTVPSSSADTKLPPLFQSILVPGELSHDQLELLHGFQIDVIGQAHVDPAGFSNLIVP